MTIEQIQKIKQFIIDIDKINVDEFDQKLAEIKNYLGSLYTANIYADNTWSAFNGYSDEDFEKDKLSLKSFLSGLLEKDKAYSRVRLIIDLIDEGRRIDDNSRSQENYIKKVYTALKGKMDFSQDIVAFCTGTRNSRLSVVRQFNKSSIEGLVIKLENYATELINKNEDAQREAMIQVVNNVNVNVDVEIKNAIDLVNESGWPDQQTEDVLKKINEIENLIKSSENKKTKWEKVKNILNWVISQGIQVASIVVPLIGKVFK